MIWVHIRRNENFGNNKNGFQEYLRAILKTFNDLLEASIYSGIDYCSVH